MEYLFNFDKLGYLKGGKPGGCILCLVSDGSDEVERMVVHETPSFVVSLNFIPIILAISSCSPGAIFSTFGSSPRTSAIELDSLVATVSRRPRRRDEALGL